MKKICLILSVIFVVSGNCQDINKKLQNKIWFVTGDLLKPEPCLLNGEESTIKTLEVKFLAEGLMQIPYDGDFILTNSYEIKNEMIKIYYTVNYPQEKRKKYVAHYYKIKELPNQKGFEFTPGNSSEF